MTISQYLSSLSKGVWYVMMGKTLYRKENWCRFLQENKKIRRESGKRETGENPVRSRHCDKGVQILFPHGKPLVHGTGKAESV